jgi:hypothetical protein
MSEMITTSDNDNSNPKLPFDVFHHIVDILAYLDDIDTLEAFVDGVPYLSAIMCKAYICDH